ncbi:M1 family metallopeptidase [soil metagenome]
MAVSPPKGGPTPNEGDRYRLPRAVLPSHYRLTLEPDLGSASFTGTEEVTVEAIEAVDEVVLNAVDLDITEAWIERAGGGGGSGAPERIEATVRLDEATERAHLALATTAAPGSWRLHARFRGTLNDQLKGFYRSTFTDEGGAERVIATTQFEATDARRAFPCWDEPDMKASFGVTLVVEDGLLAVSNAAEVDRRGTDDGRVAVTFADTMVMSTYLVAFVVGPLEATAAVDVNGTPLRVIHAPGKAHLTAFALEVGAFALDYFERYYGIDYPGDKLDLVAIPDFAFGAMENLGCVTFREVALLVDPDRVSQPELQNVADVIAHELAHMWFGDLVTMSWWNGIWLNEAFATFMEMAATDAFRPAWKRWVSFGISRSAALDTDSLDSTRPIEYPVVSPADAEGMFDILTYEKGAAVVRMLEQYLGADRFRDGIRAYLQAHRYANTETTDLWDAIEDTSGEPTRRIMDSWIFQGGYPLVSVGLEAGGRVLRLTQERFRYPSGDATSDGAPSPDGGDARWAIPLLVGHGGDGAAQLQKLLLDGDALEVDLPSPAAWVVVNRGGSGFYRVRYAPDLLAAITSCAQEVLEPIERYGLVDDTWAAVLAGATPAADFLVLARGFGDETYLSVWQRICGSLGALERLVDGDALARYRTTVRGLIAPALHRLGDDPDEGEPERTATLRATLFETLGVIGDDQPTRHRAERILAAHDADPEASNPALLAAAVRVLAPGADEARFDDFLARSRAATNPQDELRYLGALADVTDPELANRFHELTLTNDVRSQDGPYLVRRALSNRSAGPLAWAFVKDRWEALNTRFPSNSIVRMLEGIRALSTPGLAADVEEFFTHHEVPQGARTLTQHVERLRVNVALREREAEDLAASL